MLLVGCVSRVYNEFVRKSIFLLSLLFPLVVFGFCSLRVLADSLSSNRMKIGEVDKSLPEKEIRNYYAQMEPIMLKYFGPPFSNFAINIKVDLDEDTESPADIDPKTKSLILKKQAKNYFEGLKKGSKEDALRVIYGTMEHELSHAMYLYKDLSVDFGGKWAYEGWARFLGDLIHAKINDMPLSLSPYFAYYQDRNLMLGAGGYRVARLLENQSLTYDKATAVHFLLTAAASINDLGFYKRLNSKIYEYLETKDFTPLPSGMKQPLGYKDQVALGFDEYKEIIKPLLKGVKVDGVDAYSWYFDNLDFSNNPKTGKLAGVNVSYNLENRAEKIVGYIFERNRTADGFEEKPIADVKLNITLKDSYGKTVLDKTRSTDSQGKIEIDFPRDVPSGAYLALVSSKDDAGIKSKIFVLKRPKTEDKENYLYGVLLDENDDLVNGAFASLVKSDYSFVYKDNGLFILDVPFLVNRVNLDFLGKTYEVTKGPFARVYTLKLDQKQIKSASLRDNSELEAGKIKISESQEEKSEIRTIKFLNIKNIFEGIVEWIKRLLKIS